MTDRVPRRRASQRELRAWAWVAGGLAFFAPWAGLGVSPKPAVSAADGRDERPVIVIRRITRQVVVRHRASAAPVQYVSTTGSSGATVNAAPPAPTTNTGGS